MNPLEKTILISGKIAKKDKTRYAYFSMQNAEVVTKLMPLVKEVRNSMSPPGKVMMCKFDDHDGPHLSLWMTSEAKMKSVESIKNFVGKTGEFEVINYGFRQAKNSIILEVTGLL